MTDATPAPAPARRGLFSGAFDALLAPFRNRDAEPGKVQREKHRQYRILFVDVGNAARSQVAQAYATIYGFHAESAGTFPATRVAPEAVAVMADQGIDISHFRPKPLDTARLEAFDRVITMGDSLPKPWRNHENVLEWNLLDPQGLPLEAYRQMRDDCEKRIRKLAKELRVERPELVVLNA